LCVKKKYLWMAKPLSIDLRERIIDAYDQGSISQQAVAQRFCVSVEFVKKLIRQRRELGDIGPQYRNCGRKPKITEGHRQRMTELIEEQPDLTLEEIGQRLGLSCTIQAIHYVLKDMGITYKKRRCEPASKTAKTLQ
jgi:transposase